MVLHDMTASLELLDGSFGASREDEGIPGLVPHFDKLVSEADTVWKG